MSQDQLATPVAFFIFNRPDTTEQVFAAIARARPRKLLVVADGARPDRPGEAEKCAATRAIIGRVDWDCEVLTNYSEVNLGCKRRLASGLDWVFSLAEEAIILEDDCLPDPTFFAYCEALLERYRTDDRITHISGDNFQAGPSRTPYGYYFSRYSHVWGWASWRRAWRHYDVEMALWPEIRDGGWLGDMLGDPKVVAHWTRLFETAHGGRIDTWDYQWMFACWVQGGLAILPRANLISNIGFLPGATHTVHDSRLANLPVHAAQEPLCHPPYVIRDAEADRYTEQQIFLPPPLAMRVKRWVRRWGR